MPPERIRAGQAIVMFVFVMGGQLVGMIVGVMVVGASGRMDGVVMLLSFVVSAAILYVLVRSWMPHFAGVRPPSRVVLIAAVCGAGIAAAYLLALGHLLRLPDVTQLGPTAQIERQGWISRAALVCVVLLLAPPLEEVLYRGVLLEGFTESWGRVAAGFAVTLLFVGTHVFEHAHHWPGIVPIVALAIGTLFIRWRTRSIAACVVAHVAYNAVMVVWSFL